MTVEIVETLLYRRKYNRGRMLKNQVWAVGGICRESKEAFVVYVENRTSKVLMKVINEHVNAGTIINTDGWAAYRSLTDHGFENHTVNHLERFVDPKTKVHTNLIENLWKRLKQDLPPTGVTQEKLHGRFYEFLWLRKYKQYAFANMLQHMSDLFPGR